MSIFNDRVCLQILRSSFRFLKPSGRGRTDLDRLNYRIFLPNGVKDKPAILKCCLPKGIQIIVMHNKTPKKRCVKQIQIPPIQIQMIFMIKLKQPLELSFSTTWLPNGQRANIPNFNVCNPNGIPMIEIKNGRLAKIYSTAVANPPKISQMIFPMNLINLNVWLFLTAYYPILPKHFV